MARSDLLLNLVKAANRGDKLFFRQTLETLVAEEHRKQHHVLADRLAEYLKIKNGNIISKDAAMPDEKLQNLLFETTPRRSFEELLLTEGILRACHELVEEHSREELLRSHNMEPRHKILLAGPPGNGKTSLAEALAKALMFPLVIVRYESVIGSYLGETSARLRHIFDYVRTRHCVLFFDEFDTIGKERGDVHETGEIKRVVSSLLLQIDNLPSHVVVITATNHPELLDRAVWRRFQVRLYLPFPTRAQLVEIFCRLNDRLGQPVGVSPEELAHKFEGVSFSEVEEFCSNILRRSILSSPNGNMHDIFSNQLSQWHSRFSPNNRPPIPSNSEFSEFQT